MNLLSATLKTIALSQNLYKMSRYFLCQVFINVKINVNFQEDNITVSSSCFRLQKMQHALIVTQADKGKTIVIIHSNEKKKKVHSFLLANNFSTLTSDPTEKFQKSIHKAMQDCNLIADKCQINT
jgi:DNA-binding sugar fermentation-stimulating protein